MNAIEQIREKYFKDQYVKLITNKEDYEKEVNDYGSLFYNEAGDTVPYPIKPSNGKTEDLNFKLTTLAYSLKDGRITQYFTDYSILSLCHEMGHFVSVDLENCMQPALGLPFVGPDSDPQWIEEFAIQQETSAFCYEAILMGKYDPTYQLSTRFIIFNSVMNMNHFYKEKYGKGHLIGELHPAIKNIFDEKRKTITLESFDELWFGRNKYFLENPVLAY